LTALVQTVAFSLTAKDEFVSVAVNITLDQFWGSWHPLASKLVLNTSWSKARDVGVSSRISDEDSCALIMPQEMTISALRIGAVDHIRIVISQRNPWILGIVGRSPVPSSVIVSSISRRLENWSVAIAIPADNGRPGCHQPFPIIASCEHKLIVLLVAVFDAPVASAVWCTICFGTSQLISGLVPPAPSDASDLPPTALLGWT
jgi:hypothetical protein